MDGVMWVMFFCWICPAQSMWPPNYGFKGPINEITLAQGTIVDRYGAPTGRFVSPIGIPFYQRSLPHMMETYTVYVVLKHIEGVEVGHAVGWFGWVGCGMQYRLPKSVEKLLIDGYLGESCAASGGTRLASTPAHP